MATPSLMYVVQFKIRGHLPTGIRVDELLTFCVEGDATLQSVVELAAQHSELAEPACVGLLVLEAVFTVARQQQVTKLYHWLGTDTAGG